MKEHSSGIVGTSKVSQPSGAVNDAPSVDAPGIAGSGRLLEKWLGTFWTDIHKGGKFVEALQDARAVRMAQLQLDLAEAIKMQDREEFPVLHRERWHPIVVRRSGRNTGASTMFRLGDETGLRLGVVGGSDSNDSNDAGGILVPGSMARLGSKESLYANVVVYPLEGASADLESVATCIVDSIPEASVVIPRGVGFEIRDGFIALASQYDPFPDGESLDDAPFGRFPVYHETSQDGTVESDEEAVLWACDSMFDMNFVRSHLGGSLGFDVGSTEAAKRVVNAVWNTVSSGGTPLLLKSLIAALCGVPTVAEEGEVVERILDTEDGGRDVVTTKNVYRFGPYSVLRRDIVPGAKLRRFDMLDTAVRIYPCVRDADSVGLWSEYASSRDEFVADVPSISIPPSMFRADVSSEVAIGWDPVDVQCAGNDGNGNPRLWFRIDGMGDDNDAFWRSVWDSCEKSKVSLADIMKDCLKRGDGGTIGQSATSYGQVSPMDFFMKNLIGANTVVVTVRPDELSDDAPLYDPAFFGVLRECLPAGIRLYIIEHAEVGSSTKDDDDEDGDGDDADYGIRAGRDFDEKCEAYARGDYLDEVRMGRDVTDRMKARWIPKCRRHGDD